MDVRIANQRIVEINNPKSTGLVVELPAELLGTRLSQWLYVDGDFEIDPEWVNPDEYPEPFDGIIDGF
jgi:hypothetical protein